ncbi:hypothetical protein GALMADRAFT_886357 [Galerina marginata CBS 339.88]|uniref:Uncharacterized protein n=1 Tax=Galerina marginata (strain CBS 339.88) TaxID=685588 RepID=A0A067SHU6_GALM3|nr:hypothetical protein GALMADRAFT_886357 [Galerina marginata CBS 339.88]
MPALLAQPSREELQRGRRLRSVRLPLRSAPGSGATAVTVTVAGAGAGGAGDVRLTIALTCPGLMCCWNSRVGGWQPSAIVGGMQRNLEQVASQSATVRVVRTLGAEG